METYGNQFEYSIIEYLDQLSTEDRVKRENEVIADAIYRYKKRVYNIPNVNVKDILHLLHRNIRKNKIEIGVLRRRKNQVEAVGRIFYPVVIDNIWYSQIKYAAATLGMNAKTVSYRLRSPLFPTWITLKDLTRKKLPDIPEIKTKAEQFYNKLSSYKT